MSRSQALVAAVERARFLAEEAGELLVAAPYVAPELPAEVRAVLLDWKNSGDFTRAVSEIGDENPEVAAHWRGRRSTGCNRPTEKA